MIREVNVSQLTDVVERLCIEANEHLPSDVKCAIEHCRACEDGEIVQGVLDNIIENYKIADAENVPICQDTGMACVFLEIGQDVHLTGGDLAEAIDEGVRRGYDKGYLRKSVVKDPVRRGNTGDNTPAMLYTEIVPGDKIKVTVGPKGFGSENMSMIRGRVVWRNDQARGHRLRHRAQPALPVLRRAQLGPRPADLDRHRQPDPRDHARVQHHDDHQYARYELGHGDRRENCIHPRRPQVVGGYQGRYLACRQPGTQRFRLRLGDGQKGQAGCKVGGRVPKKI